MYMCKCVCVYKCSVCVLCVCIFHVAYITVCSKYGECVCDLFLVCTHMHAHINFTGFHMCVLIVQLSEHLPDDARLCELKHSPRVRDLLVHFRDKMGCIEILGKSGRVERVYFEVKKTYRKQWKTPQIEVSHNYLKAFFKDEMYFCIFNCSPGLAAAVSSHSGHEQSEEEASGIY